MSNSAAVDVVVGAASGMGAAAARALKGARPMLLVDRDEAGVRKIAEEIGGEAVVCDITDPASVADLAARITSIGSMIVTAGVSGPPGEVTIGINLIGVASLLQALDHAVGEGTAVVLFATMTDLVPLPSEIVSILDEPLDVSLFDRLRQAGMDPNDPGMGYQLSKVGVVRLVRNNAFSWWQRGARIVSVSPGVIDTPLLAKTAHLPVVQEMKRIVRRFGHADEVGRVAAFLASDAASYVNGINVTVDGGYVTSVQENAAIQQQLADKTADSLKVSTD